MSEYKPLRKFDEEYQQKVMLRIWERMLSFFGDQWVRSYGAPGDQNFTIWTEELGDMTLEQLARGMKTCSRSAESFPPTLGQFRGMCLTEIRGRNFTEERIKASTGNPVGDAVVGVITRAKKTGHLTETAKAEIAKMQAILRGGA